MHKFFETWSTRPFDLLKIIYCSFKHVRFSKIHFSTKRGDGNEIKSSQRPIKYAISRLTLQADNHLCKFLSMRRIDEMSCLPYWAISLCTMFAKINPACFTSFRYCMSSLKLLDGFSESGIKDWTARSGNRSRNREQARVAQVITFHTAVVFRRGQNLLQIFSMYSGLEPCGRYWQSVSYKTTLAQSDAPDFAFELKLFELKQSFTFSLERQPCFSCISTLSAFDCESDIHRFCISILSSYLTL